MAHIITFVIFGGFGVMMLVVGITQLLQQRRNLSHGERVDATIEYAAVFVSTSSDTDPRLGHSTSTTTYRPDVRFSYVVAGRRYESDLLYPTSIVRTYASQADAALELAGFPVHAKVRAYVDPSHPERAFLNAEAGNGPVVFIILGLLLPPVAWFVGKYV